MHNNASSLDYAYLYANTIIKHIFNIFLCRKGPTNVNLLSSERP